MSPIESSVKFKGTLQKTATEAVLQKASFGYRTLGKALSMKEGNIPYITCLQDTTIAWLPKVLVSRSRIEGLEVSFLEFAESAMVYFLPLKGSKLLAQLFHQLPGKAGQFNPELLTKPLSQLKKELSKEELAKVLPVKLAVILATIGSIGLVGESLSNYGKNLMTAHFFKKDKFSDVINLSQGQINTDTQKSPLVQKSFNRLIQVTAAFAGMLLGGALLSRFGYKAGPTLQKVLTQSVSKLDFNFEKGTSYGLGKGMLAAIMGASTIPYLDSSRDRYERLENLCRLPIVFFYLLKGQDLLESFMLRFKGKGMNSLLKADQKTIKSMEELAQEALINAGGSLEQVNTPEVLQKAADSMKSSLRAKALHVGVPLGVGMMTTGIGLGLLNRFWTAARYKKQNVACQSYTPSVHASPYRPAFKSNDPPAAFNPYSRDLHLSGQRTALPINGVNSTFSFQASPYHPGIPPVYSQQLPQVPTVQTAPLN